jgi:FRG domain
MKELFDLFDSTIEDLGQPEITWYRGHARSHTLLPSILKFDNNFNNEKPLFEQYNTIRTQFDTPADRVDWLSLIEMHHCYVPTRLLAWTSNIAVALFCSIIRESDPPSVFFLDPVKINLKSNIRGILNVDDYVPLSYKTMYLEKGKKPPDYPISIQQLSYENILPIKKGGFTVHISI